MRVRYQFKYEKFYILKYGIYALAKIFSNSGSVPIFYFPLLLYLYILGVQTQGRLDDDSFESDVCCSSCGCLQVIYIRLYPWDLDRRYSRTIQADGLIVFIYSLSPFVRHSIWLYYCTECSIIFHFSCRI